MNDPSTPALDTFVCVHSRDVGYLLEAVLRSYDVHFMPKARLILITNDAPHLRGFLNRTGVGQGAIVTSDGEWLSEREMALPGWFRQQIIKLRSYEFCQTDNFCNLGADTILLQPIYASDLIDGDFPILYYTRHRLPNPHFRYEQERIQHIARILRVDPVNARRYVDFINDLFSFNRTALTGLNELLRERYGDEPYVTLLEGMADSNQNRNKFGEWTLYSVYLLDYLQRRVTLRNTRPTFLHQVHSKLALHLYPFNTKVAHFVGKDFDVDYIEQQIAHHVPALRAPM